MLNIRFCFESEFQLPTISLHFRRMEDSLRSPQVSMLSRQPAKVPKYQIKQTFLNCQTWKSCPFCWGLRKFALDHFIVIFSAFLKKNTNGGLILSLGKFGMISYLCSGKHKFRINYFWTCVLYWFLLYFWKKITAKSSKFLSQNGQN